MHACVRDYTKSYSIVCASAVNTFGFLHTLYACMCDFSLSIIFSRRYARIHGHSLCHKMYGFARMRSGRTKIQTVSSICVKYVLNLVSGEVHSHNYNVEYGIFKIIFETKIHANIRMFFLISFLSQCYSLVFFSSTRSLIGIVLHE